MKTKIRRFSKSVLSVILAMTLIMSTMLIGTISVNATISGLSALYFTPDSSTWASSKATFKLEYTTSDSTNTRVPFELIDSENSVYKATLDSSTTYTKFKFWRCSSDGSSDWNSSNEFDTIPTGMNYFTKTSNWWNTWVPTSSDQGTWSTYGGSTGGDDPTAVTDENLLSVLKGEKVMFYFGDNWSSGKKYLRTGSGSGEVVSGDNDSSYSYNINSATGTYYYKLATVASAKYYISNSSWEGVQMSADAEAGKAYILNTGIDGNTNNNIYTLATGTTKVSTSINDSNSKIQTGEKLSVSPPTEPGTSVLGKTNVIKYYIGDSSGNYAEYTLTDGKLDTSSLNEGSYTLKTVLYDQDKLYVVADTDDFTVSAATTTYNITKGTVDEAKGNFTISATSAAEGATVTVTPSPETATDYSYAVDEVSYTTDGGTTETVTAADGVYSFAMPADNVTVNVTFKKKYTITSGTCIGGSVGLGAGGTSTTLTVDAADSGTVINVTAKPDTNYEFVSWVDTDGVTFTDSTSSETTATVTKNATITATFRSTAVATYYLSYYHKTSETNGENKYEPMFYNKTDGTYTFNFTSTYVNENSGKFKITNSNSTDPVAADQDTMCINRNNPTIQVSDALTADNVTVTNLGSGNYYDIQVSDTTKEYKITFTPNSTNPLTGTIYVDYLSSTPTLATPKIKGDSSALPGSTITVALDNQKDFGTDENGDGKYTSDYENLTFTYTVTASDGSTPVVTSTASGKILASDGTTAINDKISFTASSDNGVTYTITCKVSAEGFDDVTSSKLTVKVGTIPYAQADRIYAYAKTLGADETPALNAWVASETNASKLDTHNDSGDVKPTLGKTSDTDIRIFLPTTASSSKVVLYNSFSTSITVNDTEIQSGKYAEVSYTPNQEYTISNGKKLTIYKSTADGALYVNNTGDYASIDDNGALSMITKLYSDKEAGEIAAGNAGALADSNGVQDVAVKKIKGRGNSTWVSANKKSFNVTFTDNIKAFGFKQGKKFSLLANFKDPSLSRNKILYELADLMGVKYSPDAATVDLYMNGLYMGSYLMCQKVDVGSKELVNDLGKTLLEDLYTDSASGKVPESAKDKIKSSGFSFLMELDSNAGRGDFYTTVDTQNITIKEPEYLNDDGSIPTDAVTQAAITFVQNKYSELNTAMSNTSITLEDLNKIIDVESLVKYYLINEIAKNYDIGVSSTYLVYNYTKGKFYISPLWDMDVTTGNCKVTDTNYQSYEGNWTDNTNEGTGNKFMALVFNNPQVQSAARKLWTGSYYTTLTNYIDTLTTMATSVEGSLNCNYTKWNYPYGFQGKYSDNVQALTSLNVATYNPSDNTYTVASSSTSYATTAVGQTQYVSDWLKSRVAWMSKKYNTYTIAGLTGWSGDSDKATMTYNGDGTHTYTFTSAADPTYGIKIYTDNGLSDDISAPQNSTHSCIWYDPDVQLIVDTTRGTLTATKGTHNNFGVTVTEASAEAPVYLIYNQKTNTLTLSDTQSTSSNPSVTLSGSAVASEDIKDGTAVTLTAKITPATSNNVVVTGDYTATLYIGDKVVTTKTVTFADDATEETTMNAVFSTYLEGTNQTYKVVVTCNDGEQDRKGTSNTVTYKQTGVKDQKIYFDPSPYITADGAIWKNVTAQDSVVTVTLSDSTTFKMYIDSNDVHGLDKGVFRADIDEETLAKLQSSSTTITFSMDGTDLSCSVAGQSDIADGWIYNYSSQTSDGQMTWEQYNVAYEESYPGGCTTYAEFKDYLAAQSAVGGNTDNIVYFDNSASKFYNVYMYCWDSGTVGSDNVKNGLLMKKLPYADIWYYDFGSVTPSANFLFKDRSGPGFGTDYQQTVDLSGNTKDEDTSNDAYVYNGDGAKVYLNFAGTIDTPNPIFVTQNFYKCTVQNLSEDKKTDGLKFRAFNTQWDEFADVVASDVQTKAVDIYFDLHDDSATDIQLYHTSTNSKYTFASEFTRLTQMPGSTIYHSTIMLPYTDNGIAFKFDKFVVNYSGGKKTCAMSANVQPTFTCINTGEVWYEINSEFDNVGYDTSASSASLLKANSPLLTATTYTDIYLIGGMNDWTESDVNWQLSSTDGNKYTGTFTISGGSSAIAFKVFDSSNSGNKYFANGNYQFNSSNTIALGLNNNQDTADMSIMPIATSGNITLNVTYYREYSGQTRLEITQTVATADATYYVAGDSSVSNSPFTGSEAKMSKNDSGVYYYHFNDIAAGDYNFKITDGSSNWDVANWSNYSPDKSSLTNITVSNPNSYNKIKVSLSSTTSFTVYYDGTNVYIIEDSSSPTPTISLSPASTSLTLVDGTATTTLITTKTNADDATVTYTVDLPTGTVSANGTTFTATAAGKYTVTASITVNGTTYSAPVTIIVSEEVTEDYCGVLAYNHSTATFDVTGGGTIDKTDVVLTNGYYTNGNVTTGYTSYDGTTYTVIYALPSTASSGATTSYSSTTSHSNEGTGEGKYSFDGWTKDGVISTESKTLSDSISGIATVAYIANWSEEVMVTYTFTYVYDMYDISQNGKEYHEDGEVTTNSDYKVQVSLSESATKADVIAAYLANAPKISSDYFTYTFDDTNVAITVDLNNHTAEATAKIASVKKYKVTFNNEDGIVSADEYFYQNIVTLTQSAPSGYVTVWKDEKGNTLYVGDSYSFRITRNIIIESESVTSSSLKPATYVNEPTYEFFTSGTTEYVKFKVRVDNVLAGVTPYEYGTLYFFTDGNGVPVDSTISVDSNIDSDKLTAAALGSASTGIKKYDATDIVNADHKFIYAPYIKNTAANRDRYLRVYSYYIYKDKEGNDVVVISSDSVLASIRNALNES